MSIVLSLTSLPFAVVVATSRSKKVENLSEHFKQSLSGTDLSSVAKPANQAVKTPSKGKLPTKKSEFVSRQFDITRCIAAAACDVMPRTFMEPFSNIGKERSRSHSIKKKLEESLEDSKAFFSCFFDVTCSGFMPLLWKLPACDLIMAVSVALAKEAGFNIKLTEIIRTVFESLGESGVFFEVMPDQEQGDVKEVLVLFQNSWKFVFHILKSASLITDEDNIKDMLKFNEGLHVSADSSVIVNAADFVYKKASSENALHLDPSKFRSKMDLARTKDDSASDQRVLYEEFGHETVKSFLQNQKSLKLNLTRDEEEGLPQHILESTIRRSWMFYEGDQSRDVCILQLLRLAHCLLNSQTRSRLLFQEQIAEDFWDGCLRLSSKILEKLELNGKYVVLKDLMNEFTATFIRHWKILTEFASFESIMKSHSELTKLPTPPCRRTLHLIDCLRKDSFTESLMRIALPNIPQREVFYVPDVEIFKVLSTYNRIVWSMKSPGRCKVQGCIIPQITRKTCQACRCFMHIACSYGSINGLTIPHGESEVRYTACSGKCWDEVMNLLACKDDDSE